MLNNLFPKIVIYVIQATVDDIIRRREDVIVMPDNSGTNEYTHSSYLTLQRQSEDCFI